MLIHCEFCDFVVRMRARFCARCGKAIQRTLQATAEPSAEIELDHVDPTDCIVIQTKNSEYEFSLIDPAGRRGILSGGEFGRCDATLVGALVNSNDSSTSDTSWLRTNARALFYVQAEAGIRRFTTSPVIGLVHLRRINSSDEAS